SIPVYQFTSDTLPDEYYLYKVIGSSFHLEGVPQFEIPEHKDNITQWAKDEHKFNHRSIHELSFILGCQVGYEYAKSKGIYTEKDIRTCYKGVLQNVGTSVKQSDLPSVDDYIQSLKIPMN